MSVFFFSSPNLIIIDWLMVWGRDEGWFGAGSVHRRTREGVVGACKRTDEMEKRRRKMREEEEKKEQGFQDRFVAHFGIIIPKKS